MNPAGTHCGCGSGLKAGRCCALDLATVSSDAAAATLKPAIERAESLYFGGNIDDAQNICLEVLDLAPSQLAALILLYRIRRDAGVMRAAIALLRRIVSLDPNLFWATSELALHLLGRGALGEAEHHARNAVRIAPEDPQSHNLMGMTLTEANRPRIGEYHYHRVLELMAERDPVVLANLAWNLKNQGRIAEARALYEEATRDGPEIAQTLLGWARMEEADRNFDRASELLDRAARLSPGNPSIVLSHAVVASRRREYDTALALLDSIAAMHGSLGPNEQLEKGRLLDRLGRIDEAFSAFSEGKRLATEMSGLAYQDAAAENLYARLRSFFAAKRLRIIPAAAVREDVAQPIFILGFPRSGTTLVEQTLSAHPAISAGDELPFVTELAAAMPRVWNSPLAYPEALTELWMGDRRHGLDEMRDTYLQRVAELDILVTGAKWFTDKMPLNETHLGLIALMFPKAPLLHVRRHPLDVVLSVFSNQLTHGFCCAFALETAAKHFARTFELVEHYRREMKLNYLSIRYEDIVAEQEASVKGLLDFVGAPFDPACLQFHENRRYARTASYAQVTEPLYDSSTYRYRRYLKHLAPVIPILKPAIDALGYGVD